MFESIVLALLTARDPAPSQALTVERVRSFDHLRVTQLAAAPVGARVAVALEDRTVRIFDVAQGQTLRSLTGHPFPVRALAWSPDGRLVATADESARIWIWDAATGRKLREFTRQDAHVRGVQNLTFSSDGKRLASTGADDIVILWDPATGRRLARVQGKDTFYGGRFAADGRFAIGTLGKGLQLLRSANLELAATPGGHGGQGVLDVAVNRAGNRIVTVGKDGLGIVWDGSGRPLGTLRGHKDWAIRCEISPSGRYVATSSSDTTVIVWDLRTFREVARLEGQSPVGAPLAWTGDGRFLITANLADGLQVNRVSPPQGR